MYILFFLPSISGTIIIAFHSMQDSLNMGPAITNYKLGLDDSAFNARRKDIFMKACFAAQGSIAFNLTRRDFKKHRHHARRQGRRVDQHRG